MHAADQRRFAFLPNVRRDPARAHRRFTVPKRVAFVETAVPRAPHAAAALEHHAIERRGQRPLVMEIGAAQHDREWHATPVGQDVALRAKFRSVSWVRSRELPPFGAFTITESNAPHCH